jgi:transposase
LSTKIHLRAQGTGKPIAMVVTPGQTHEAVVFEQVMERGAVRRTRGRAKQRPGRIAGDKAYSSRRIRRYLRRRGIRVTIPHKSNERRGQFDKRVYKQRNLVERLINGYTGGPLP